MTEERIVSLAPCITETLYAIGLGDKIIGRTRFCAYPPEAAHKPVVGGFHEINLESIARLKPTLVVLPDDMSWAEEQIQALGIRTREFNCQSLKGYMHTLESWAGAANLVSDFKKRMGESGKYRGRALFLLLNEADCGAPFRQAVGVGHDVFYESLMRGAGYENAYRGKLAYPWLSQEDIVRAKPDLLVLAIPNCSATDLVQRTLISLEIVDAARTGRVLVLDDPGDTVPGPRALRTLQKIYEFEWRGKGGD